MLQTVQNPQWAQVRSGSLGRWILGVGACKLGRDIPRQKFRGRGSVGAGRGDYGDGARQRGRGSEGPPTKARGATRASHVTVHTRLQVPTGVPRLIIEIMEVIVLGRLQRWESHMTNK